MGKPKTKTDSAGTQQSLSSQRVGSVAGLLRRNTGFETPPVQQPKKQGSISAQTALSTNQISGQPQNQTQLSQHAAAQLQSMFSPDGAGLVSDPADMETVKVPHIPVDERLKHLLIQPHECETIMTAIKSSKHNVAIDILRRQFKLMPPPPPPSHILLCRPSQIPARPKKYDRHAEDVQMRDVILSQYLLDATCFVYNLGMSPLQCSIWLTIFKKAHDQYISQAKHSGPKCDPDSCFTIFKTTLLELVNVAGKPMFSINETKQLVDYIVQSYGQHVRLVTYAFTMPQDVQIDPVSKTLDVALCNGWAFLPLAQGIPADKWDEYCRKEDERRRIARAAEEEAKESARLQVLAEAKSKADAERAAILLQAQLDAEKALCAPFQELPPAAVPKPTFETLFRKPRTMSVQQIQSAQQQQQQQHVGAQAAVAADTRATVAFASQGPNRPSGIGSTVAQQQQQQQPTNVLGSDSKQQLTREPDQQTLPASGDSAQPGAKDKEASEVIPLDAPISRADLAQIVASNISTALTDLIQTLLVRMDAQSSQVQGRIDRLQAAIQAREDERTAREKEKEEAAAAAAAAAAEASAAAAIASVGNLTAAGGAGAGGKDHHGKESRGNAKKPAANSKDTRITSGTRK
ncbi:hypothetical protein BC831DRAFT_416351 [Entophlyctis helioformis]|nr:hypothetical protein BC831DRAFT_416351 [Entophlyctis helioformis]